MADPLLDAMSSTVAPEAWPTAESALVVGLSGGPDSVALAFLLEQLSATQGHHWQIHVAHLNHRLRGADSDEDAEFVRRLAEQQQWVCHIDDVDVRQVAASTSLTVEEAARNERYAFFERVLTEVGAEVVATAHHADDNAETVLHRIIRGTGFRGLSGIPVCRPLREGTAFRLVRPLLGIRRQDILDYLDRHSISYRRDLTNDTSDHTRNRIRNDLLPTLERQYNPTVREALLRLAEQSTWTNELLTGIVDRTFDDITMDPSPPAGTQHVVLDAGRLLETPQIVQTEVVRRAIRECGAAEKRLSFEHYVAITRLAARNVSGKKLELPGGMVVHYDRKRLTFSPSSPTPH